MRNFAQFIEKSLKGGHGVPWDMQIPGRTSDSAEPSGGGTPRAYESPQVIVIGKIRDITTGNASSGNADANSQYYW
jgi:hypothetical protein